MLVVGFQATYIPKFVGSNPVAANKFIEGLRHHCIPLIIFMDQHELLSQRVPCRHIKVVTELSRRENSVNS